MYSALGALPWNAALAYLGYLFGANWDKLQEAFHRWNRYFYVALAVAVVAAVVWKWRDVRRKRATRAGQSG